MNARPTPLYREVPIEDLEQAKALPHGTIARIQLENGDWTVLALSDLQHPGKPQQRFWFATFSMNAYLDDALVGGIALVPVEAEEETRTDLPGRRGIRPVRRIVTPWEEV